MKKFLVQKKYHSLKYQCFRPYLVILKLTNEEELESFFAEEFRKRIVRKNPETYYENLIYNLRDYEPELLKELEA